MAIAARPKTKCCAIFRMPDDNELTKKWRSEAQSLLRANRFDDARAFYRQICDAEPEDADAWHVLGSVNGILGDHAAAEKCFRRVIALCPDRSEGHFNIGISLRNQNRTEEAAMAFRAALKHNPDYAEAHNALGYVLTIGGQRPAAEQHFRRAIALNPGLPDPQVNLGNLLRTQNQNEEALACYRRAIEARPDHADAMISLSVLLSKLMRIEEAIEWDRRILALYPDRAEVHYHLGNALLGLNKVEDAVASFHTAWQIRSDFAEAAGAEAQALQKLGRFEESAQCIRAALDRGQRSAALVVALAVVSRRLGQRAETIALAETMLARDKLSGDDARQLHFAAGKLHDELEHYAEAFEHYRQANALHHRRFARDAHDRLVNDSIRFFDPDRIRNMPRSRNHSERPLFIVGMPRSGTSLIEQILASHARIFGGGEMNIINQYANGLQARLGADAPYPSCLGAVTPAALDEMASEYLDRLHVMDQAAVRVTDKMPHNFLHLGMIAMIFPRTRVIHVVRDPMDTCLSIYFQPFNELHAYACDLADIGYYYAYEKLMAHWRRALDVPIFEIRYEDLVADPDQWIPRLVEFCGVEWDDRCMRFYDTDRAVNTPSYEQVRQPLYARSVGRWRHYEKQLEPLRTALHRPT